jgi:hypothetical protein
MKKFAFTPIFGALLALSCQTNAHAADLLSGFGGDRGFGSDSLVPNDDSSSGQLNLPFQINFFQQTFNNFYLNNNGNITFRSPLSVYTPNAFPQTNQPMLAPYWGDVDTRGAVIPGVANKVWYTSPNANTLVVTWDQVGYFPSATNKSNSFQLVLSKVGTNGDFDAEYRYNQLQWTTGNASGGSNGLGGTPAQAGWDAGNLTNYQTLPGSRTAQVLDLVNTSNVSDATPGLWKFSFRNGTLPGQSIENPVLPIFNPGDVDPSWNFEFVVPGSAPVFIDPLIAVGYEYQLTSTGNSFASVVLPNIGDGQYTIEIWDGSAWVSAGSASSGTPFAFAPGVTRFRVNGIEVGAGLDPLNPTAFVTGVSFAIPGIVTMSQTPLTVDVPTAVPEPESYALALAGLAVAGLMIRRRRAS